MLAWLATSGALGKYGAQLLSAKVMFQTESHTSKATLWRCIGSLSLYRFWPKLAWSPMKLMWSRDSRVSSPGGAEWRMGGSVCVGLERNEWCGGSGPLLRPLFFDLHDILQKPHAKGVRSKPSQSGGRLLSTLFPDLHDLLQKPCAKGGQVQTVAEWPTIMKPSLV